ncbi:MAG TPA: hypothetical protein G4O05_08405 [Caldilineae bacterium]|nr:hypothetical protein [Caldilineae bacterium]
MSTSTLTLTLPQTEAGFLRLEGDAPLQSVVDAANAPELLKQVLRRSYSWQERNDVSIRRAALSPDRGPLWAAALMAWDAYVLFDSGEMASYAHYMRREVRPEGRSTDLLIPPEAENLRWGVADVARTKLDMPIVGAVAVVEFDGEQVKAARVALTGVWKHTADLAQAPEALVGQRLTPEIIGAVAEAIAVETDPRPDYLGSVEYRRAMAKVLSRDALERCLS